MRKEAEKVLRFLTSDDFFRSSRKRPWLVSFLCAFCVCGCYLCVCVVLCVACVYVWASRLCRVIVCVCVLECVCVCLGIVCVRACA